MRNSQLSFSQQQSRIKLFCSNNQPLHAGNYIFDNTYRNMNEKRRFEKDPKYAYFNAIIRMKNNYLKNKKDVYDHLFKPQQDSVVGHMDHQSLNHYAKNIDIHDQQLSQLQPNLTRQVFTRQRKPSHQPQRQMYPRTTFHIQKINNHSFKIYKDKRSSKFSSSNSLVQDLRSSNINNVNFQVHFRNKMKVKEEKDRPKIQMLMNEYRKMQTMKGRVNPERDGQGDLRSSGVYSKRKLGRSQRESKTPEVRKVSLDYINSLAKVLNSNAQMNKIKGRSNMSELALKFSR